MGRPHADRFITDQGAPGEGLVLTQNSLVLGEAVAHGFQGGGQGFKEILGHCCPQPVAALMIWLAASVQASLFRG